jgi:hypothetical protein
MNMRIKIFLLSLSFLISLASCYWFQHPHDIDADEVGGLEEYLIDFSKKIEGHKLLSGGLPPDLDSQKFFAILDQYYSDKKILLEVKKYPVKVYAQGESYVLILCDKNSQFALYKDLGETITFIDYPYWREKKKEPCQ